MYHYVGAENLQPLPVVWFMDFWSAPLWERLGEGAFQTTSMAKPKLLLVDDDKNALDGLVKILTHDGYSVSGVLSGYEALNLLSKKNFDIIVTDMKLPGMGGLSLVHEIRKKEESVAIVVITAYSSVKTAVEAIKCGADDYLTKPINIEELRLVLEKIWERQQLIAQNRMLKEKLKDKYKSSGLVGSTPQMKQIFHMIADVAPSTASILILGETGTERNSWRMPFIVKATGHVCLLSLCIAQRCRKVYWKARFLATRRAPLRAPFSPEKVGLRWRMEAHFFWMRWVS